jgi:hypothetical protein
MAKRKINVIDSEKEQSLTESLFKNIKRLKNQKLYPNVPEETVEVTSERRDETNREIEEGVYDEQIAEMYRDKGLDNDGAEVGTEVVVNTGSMVDELEEKIREQLEKGYASAYTKLTEKAKNGKEDISNIVKSVSKLFSNTPSPDNNKNNKADFEATKKYDCTCNCNCNTSKIVLEDGVYKEIPNTIGNYEMVNHPSHYNNYEKEVIDMIEAIWGTYLASVWCEITAFKYRMRMGTKPGNSIEQDINKEGWYLNKAAELKSKINN